MLPYITVTELEQIEKYAANMSSLYMTLDCKGVNFDTIDHASDPVNIPGIWLTLSQNLKLVLFKNYKINDVEMQANFSNAAVSQDDEGYYLAYPTPYGNFYVRPTDDVYFIPRSIRLANAVAADAKFQKVEVASDPNNKNLMCYTYTLRGVIPNKISKYITKCTLTIGGTNQLLDAALDIGIVRSAEGAWILKITALAHADYTHDILVKDCVLYVD